MYTLDNLPTWYRERIVVHPVSGCWIWQTRIMKNGYGTVGVPTRLVHRVVYELLVNPIPNDLTIDHVKSRGCISKACCWPEHLEPVTLRVNILRSNSMSAINAVKTYCINGHEFTEDNTYITPRGTRNCRKCRRLAKQRFKERVLCGV